MAMLTAATGGELSNSVSMPDGRPFEFWDDQTVYTQVYHVAQANPAATDGNGRQNFGHTVAFGFGSHEVNQGTHQEPAEHGKKDDVSAPKKAKDLLAAPEEDAVKELDHLYKDNGAQTGADPHKDRQGHHDCRLR